MKIYSKTFLKYSGFSMVEILIAIVLIGILSATLMVSTGNLANAARNKVKESNAKSINRMLISIRAAGGTVADGNTNDVDTTSIKTLLDSLTNKEPSINIEGMEFKLDSRPTDTSYKLSGASPNKKVEALVDTSTEP